MGICGWRAKRPVDRMVIQYNNILKALTMRRICTLLVLACFLSGCVSLQKVSEPEQIVPQQKVAAFEDTDAPPELQNIKGEDLEEYVKKKGVIFAKTDFQGLLETRYVQFLFEDRDVKSVKPGYFFVELPAGRYKIVSVSIPVGSTTATEKMDVTLDVLPDAACYVGTLKMIGTKEKIKLGGVPVIKPGFEYTVEVVDEREEGAAAFKKNYPDFPHGVQSG
jgi:hypothetical protein